MTRSGSAGCAAGTASVLCAGSGVNAVAAPDVASLLRHRSVTTTEIYAKVDVTMLRTIAQPWPEVPSC